MYSVGIGIYWYCTGGSFKESVLRKKEMMYRGLVLAYFNSGKGRKLRGN